MTAGPLERARPYAPAFFLILAAAAAGLREPGAWLLFGPAAAVWTALRPGGLSFSGREAALLFFGWIGAAAVFSPEPSVSLAAAGRCAVYALFFFSAASGGGGGRNWLRAVYALGALAAAALVAQRLFLPYAFGLIGRNPNYSAAFCAAAFAPAALALASSEGRRGKLLYGSLAALLAAGLAASGSRGGALAALLAAACGYGFTRRWRWLAGLLLLAAAAAALLPGEAWRAALKFDDPRAFARPQLWAAALKAAAASPLLGWGPGRFAEAFELFKFPVGDWLTRYGHTTLHAHGEFFNLAAEAGFPAALLLLFAAAQGLSAGGPGRAPYRLAALAALLQGSVDIVFYSGAVSLLFWGSLGFAAAGEEPADTPKLRAWLAAAALLCLLAPYAARLAAGPSAGGSRGPVAALARARAGAAAAPFNALFPADEGSILAAAGDLAGAEAAFKNAIALEPNFAGAKLALAGALAAEGRAAEACGGLAGLPWRGPGVIRNDYDRAVLLHDQERAARLNKDLCGKKKAGAATATSPGKRSKATK